MEGSLYIQFKLNFHWFNDHILEQDFNRHGVAAAFVGNEKLAIAVKNAFVVRNMVFAIVAVKIKIKLIEVEAAPVLCISFCLFNLADQSRIHCTSLLFEGIKKHTRGYPRVRSNCLGVSMK